MPAIDTASREAGLSRKQLSEHTIIALSGELDIASAPLLRERLNAALRNAGPRVIIDLSGVTFCDATGLALLIGAHRRTEPGGTSVILAAPRPHMLKLLRLTGLSRAFTIRTSVTAARYAHARSAVA